MAEETLAFRVRVPTAISRSVKRPLSFPCNKQRIARVSLCCDGHVNDVISTGKMLGRSRVFSGVFSDKMAHECFYHSTETLKLYFLFVLYSNQSLFKFSCRLPCLCTLIQNKNDVDVSVFRENQARPITVCVG